MFHALRSFSVAIVLLSVATAQSQPPAAVAPAVTLKGIGQSFSGPQSIAWLDNGTFAVGRWDGTLSLFRPPQGMSEYGPVLLNAAASPSRQGIQMVCGMPGGAMVTSNDAQSLALWTRQGNELKVRTVTYDAKYATAVSAAIIPAARESFLVTGHEMGDALIWKWEKDELKLQRAVSLKSPQPITWEYQSWHVRGVAPWKNGMMITGSEDGDLCIVSVPTGNVQSRLRYNPTAQRGINSISVLGNLVAVGNCSVGANDKNCWLYEASEQGLKPLGGIDLKQDQARNQVFCFAVQLARVENSNVVFGSTEEGLLWTCNVLENKLQVAPNPLRISDGYAAAMAFRDRPWTLLTVSHHLRLFAYSAAAAEPAAPLGPKKPAKETVKP